LDRGARRLLGNARRLIDGIADPMTRPELHIVKRGPRSDRGYVIAESAFAIPIIAVVALIAMSMVFVALSALGLQNAVHTAARDIARGVPPDAVRMSVETAHPRTTVTVAPSPQGVTVTVRREVTLLGPLLSGLAVPMQRQALVPWETGVGP